MVFHVYAKNSQDDWSWRYVIITPNQSTFESWMKHCQDKIGKGNLYYAVDGCPDFIVYDRSKFDLGRSTLQGKEAPEFLNKMMFTLQNDNAGRGITTFINTHTHATTQS